LKSIFHIITTINRGGAENQLLVLVSEQIRKGYRVSVIYLKGEPELKEEFINLGAEVIESVSKLSTVVQPLAIAKLISKRNVVLHAHLPRAELVCLVIPARFILITSRHNAEPFFPGAPKLLSNLLARLVEVRARKISRWSGDNVRPAKKLRTTTQPLLLRPWGLIRIDQQSHPLMHVHLSPAAL